MPKQGRNSEKGLLIAIHALRESYACGELSKLRWLLGQQNPADLMTKGTVRLQSTLTYIMRTNRFKVETLVWVTLSTRKTEHIECKLWLTPYDACDRHTQRDIGELLGKREKNTAVKTEALMSTLEPIRINNHTCTPGCTKYYRNSLGDILFSTWPYDRCYST